MNILNQIIASRAIGPFNEKGIPGQRANMRIDTAARAYRWNRFVRHMPAVKALEAAAPLAIRDAWPPQWFGNRGGAGAVFMAQGDKMRWIESTIDAGFRFIGWSDELDKRIGHTGWHCDEYGDSALRGGVWQLPGKDSKARLLYGYAEFDGRKETNPGSACIVMEMVSADMAGADYPVELSDDSECLGAARQADSLAESVAEDRRDYDSAYQAGRQAAEASQEAIDERAALLPLLRDYRAMRAALLPSLSEILLGNIKQSINLIGEARAKRESAWVDCGAYAESAWLDGFRDNLSEKDYRAAMIAMRIRARLIEEKESGL